MFADSAGTQIDYTANALNQYTLANGVTLPVGATGPPPVLAPYDADGNYQHGPLPVATGNATLEWDAENRLIKITRADSVVITCAYDYMGRRISKQVDSGTVQRYLYDGWNLIAEYAGTTLDKTYLWGVDLSGSMQGAGGVGGLLAVDVANSDYATYDGNGNVSKYLGYTPDDQETNGVDEEAFEVVAHYEYGAFGNILVETYPVDYTGPTFSHRFSTKPLDAETGLYYYGYRYYDPVTGRWPSRDPIGERGGVNLYGFVENSGVDRFDLLGRDGWTREELNEALLKSPSDPYGYIRRKRAKAAAPPTPTPTTSPPAPSPTPAPRPPGGVSGNGGCDCGDLELRSFKPANPSPWQHDGRWFALRPGDKELNTLNHNLAFISRVTGSACDKTEVRFAVSLQPGDVGDPGINVSFASFPDPNGSASATHGPSFNAAASAAANPLVVSRTDTYPVGSGISVIDKQVYVRATITGYLKGGHCCTKEYWIRAGK